MEDELKPEAEGTQGNPPAAETTQTQDRPPQVEGNGSAPEVKHGQSGEVDWRNKYFAQQRYTEKLSKQIEDINQWRQQVSQPAQTQAAPAPNPQLDIFTDPQAYVRNEVKQALATDLKRELGQRDMVDQQGKAEEYILSQPYVDRNSEAERAELQKIFKERGFGQAWMNNPHAAAEGVLEIYRARKGIGKQTPDRNQAGAVLSGASQNQNGRKTWTSREVAALSLTDYEKYRNDIESAYKEGRYRE